MSLQSHFFLNAIDIDRLFIEANVGKVNACTSQPKYVYISPVAINIIFVSFLKPSLSKGVFFQKVLFVFQISKKIFLKTILSLEFKFPTNNTFGGKLKFQVQDSFLEYIFFLRFGDLKNTSHFLKKSHL